MHFIPVHSTNSQTTPQGEQRSAGLRLSGGTAKGRKSKGEFVQGGLRQWQTLSGKSSDCLLVPFYAQCVGDYYYVRIVF
jgi:hypothetical protein